MSNGATIHYDEAVEDFPFSARNRVTSLNGSGAEVVQGEGPCIRSADVTSISCKVYDLGTDRDAETGVEITPAPALSSANVFDLRTSGWKRDGFGYNFRHDLAATFFADPDEWRLAEYTITLTDGTTIPIQWRLKIKSRTGT